MRGDFLHPRGRLRPYFNPIFPSLPVPAMPSSSNSRSARPICCASPGNSAASSCGSAAPRDSLCRSFSRSPPSADGGLREKLRQRLSRGAADPHELAAEFPGEAQQIGRALRELLDEGIAGTGRDGKIGLK